MLETNFRKCELMRRSITWILEIPTVIFYFFCKDNIDKLAIFNGHLKKTIVYFLFLVTMGYEWT